jgi:hypothetical protein
MHSCFGMNSARTLEEGGLGDRRAHPPDRSQRAAEAEAYVKAVEAAELLDSQFSGLFGCLRAGLPRKRAPGQFSCDRFALEVACAFVWMPDRGCKFVVSFS